MKREHGWFQIGSGLVLLLSFVVTLAGCTTWTCGKNPDGSCKVNSPRGCKCR